MNKWKKTEGSKSFLRNWIAIFSSAVGIQAMYILQNGYSMFFFTNFLGIGAGAAGLIFALSRVWDAINDPMCGVIIDKTNSRFGKTRPFILGGGIIAAVFLILLFVVPNFSVTGRTIWGTIVYNGFGMAYTAVSIAALLQTSRSTPIGRERVHMNVSYTLGASIAGILVAAMIGKLLGSQLAVENPEKGYLLLAVISAAIGLIFLIGNVVLFKDQITENETAEENTEEKTRISDMLKAVLRTPQFLIAALVLAILNMGSAISFSSLIHYCTYVIGNPALSATLMTMIYIGTFASSFAASLFVRINKITMCKISALMMAAGYLVRILDHDNHLVLTAVCFLIVNIGMGLATTYIVPILLDCADLAENRTGIKCEALTLSGYTLCIKVASGLGAALLGFGLELGKYDGNLEMQPDSAIEMIKALHLYSGLITALIGFVLFFFYKMDEKKIEEIRIHKQNDAQ